MLLNDKFCCKNNFILYILCLTKCHYYTGYNSDILESIFGRPFAKRFALCFPVLSLCLSVLSVTLVYCSQTFGGIKMKLGTQIGLGLGNIVLHGDPAAPPQKKNNGALLPQFSPMSIVAKRSPISATAEHL